MLKAIAKNDPRLYVALSGNYIKGFGYDGNNDGKIELKSSTLHLTQADFTNGLYELSEYDSDELKPLDAADYWMGSNDAYTTYWLGSGNQVRQLLTLNILRHLSTIANLKISPGMYGHFLPSITRPWSMYPPSPD